MFEQELYKQEAAEVRTQQGDLFHNYEIRNWNFSPRLYKILGASAVLNIVALAVIGTSGLLTARGCDSPFVGRVCQVLDTVYVGSLLFGTETDYADVDYTKTTLEPGDEVTFVDVTGVTPPLSYPEGYFQLANPEQQFANVTDPLQPGYIAPGIPMSTPSYGGTGLINTPQVMPKSNPNAIQGDLPTGSPLGDPDVNPTLPNRKGRRGGQLGGGGTVADANTNTNKPDANANANTNTSNPTAPNAEDVAKVDEFGVFINKRPLRLEAKETLERLEMKEVNLDAPFKVVISGKLGKADDGKTVVLKNPKPVVSNPPVKNDPVMEKFVQDWILAVGDAGWFGYLEKMNAKSLVISVEQNDTELVATVRADQPTENDARLAASGLNGILGLAKTRAKGDDQMFLQRGAVTNEGKAFILNFKIEKPVVRDMIMRKLAESKEKEAKPEGNALASPENNTAKK